MSPDQVEKGSNTKIIVLLKLHYVQKWVSQIHFLGPAADHFIIATGIAIHVRNCEAVALSVYSKPVDLDCPV